MTIKPRKGKSYTKKQPAAYSKMAAMDMKPASGLNVHWPADNFRVHIKRFRKGQPDALVGLFKHLEPDLNRYYWYCFGKPDLVEEAMQEFYQLLIIRFQNPRYTHLQVSIYKILRKDVTRRIQRFLRKFTGAGRDDPNTIRMSVDGTSFIDPLLRIQLMDCLDELKTRWRKIITFHFFKDVPLKDVPHEMARAGDGVTYENARQITVRALKQLRDCIEQGVSADA